MRILALEETIIVSGGDLPPAVASAMQSAAAMFNTTPAQLWAATAAPAGAAEYSVLARVASLVASPAGAAVVGAFMAGMKIGDTLNKAFDLPNVISDFLIGMSSGGDSGGSGGSPPGGPGGYDDYYDGYGSGPYDGFQNPPTPGGYWFDPNDPWA